MRDIHDMQVFTFGEWTALYDGNSEVVSDVVTLQEEDLYQGVVLDLSGHRTTVFEATDKHRS